MSGTCVVCGDDAAPGRFATRCPECIRDETETADAERIVLTTHYEYSGGVRLVAEQTEDGWEVFERRLMKGGDWKPVGSESATDVSVRIEKE